MNKDLAAVDVQNRVNTALPLLPAEVKNTGVTILKTTPAIVLAIGFYSEDGSLSNLFISNYLDLYVRDEIRRVRAPPTCASSASAATPCACGWIRCGWRRAA